MKARVAKKVVENWMLGLGHYTDNRFGTVLRALRKLRSHVTRRGGDPDTYCVRGLSVPGIPDPSVRWWGSAD